MKKLFSFALAIIGLYACLNFSSCSKDDKNEPQKNLDGTWLCVESNAINGDRYYSEGFFVGEALIFYNEFFTEPLSSEYTSLSGYKAYEVFDYDTADISKFTLANWMDFYYNEISANGRERLYTIKDNNLTVFELDWDRWIGTISINGDEMTFTYKYQDWNADTETLHYEYPEVYVSKFKKQ